MLELLEELNPSVIKIFQKHVHMHELTSMSINGVKGQAIALTNRYLYLIFKGFLKAVCYKLTPDEISAVETDNLSLVLKTQGKDYKIFFPAEKKQLLPQIANRLESFRLGKEKISHN